MQERCSDFDCIIVFHRSILFAVEDHSTIMELETTDNTLNSGDSFVIDGWLVEPATLRISRKGKTVKLEPKVMAVLEYLAKNPGSVVSRQELERAVWSGTIVGYDAISNAIIKLRKAFGDKAQNARVIETIPKSGYRLIGEFLPEPELDPTKSSDTAFLAETSNLTETTEKGKPSIAVLPFENMSGDKDQEYFSDGITGDIIIELSRFQMLDVIARHSSFAFKGQTIDTREIGERLGAGFLVEGSVQRSANRVRISAQLIDAGTTTNIWADRYDRAIEDIFDVQDQVTHAIVAALPGQIQKVVIERSERKRTESMTAYDCLLRGNWHYQLFTREDLFEARRLYQQAIELDPGFAQAYARLADTHNTAATQSWEMNATLQETMEIAQRALALDGNDNWARLALAWVLLRDQQYDEAEEQFEIAISLNRNDADCICWAANGFVCLGRAEEGYELIMEAMRLNPLHPAIYHAILGNALYFTGRYQDSVRAFRQCEAIGAIHHANLAVAYAQAGRIEEARSEATKFVTLTRKQLKVDGKSVPDNNSDLVSPKLRRFRQQADRDRFLDGLRKAGLSD